MPARKPKALLLYYFLLLFTGGLFSIYWPYSLMRDVNYVTGRHLFFSGLALLPAIIGIAASIGILLLIANVPAFGDDLRFFAVGMVVALLSEVAVLVTTISVYRGVLFAEGKRFRPADGFFAFGGTFLMMFVFPLMQYRMNELIFAKNAAP